MAFPLEAVPNFSEGRDRTVIDGIASQLARHARVLDVHSDPDHNRSVFTIAGREDELFGSLVAAIEYACEHVDLRSHDGVHPRVGVVDVVPIVAVRAEDMPRAAGCAIELAEFLGSAWDLTVFLYGEIAGGRGPAFFRRGGVAELQRRIDAGELAPDFGPQQIAPGVGAVLVGARRPLIAFNVNLQTEDLEFAREIAAVVRESGGGFPSVRALGFALPSRGIVQVSMNIEDPERVALREVVARVWAEARVRGVEPAESELVGLMPAASASDELGLPDLDDSRLLEPRLLEAGA